MTKIFIVDIDINPAIQRIIREDVIELTGNAKKQLTDALSLAKSIKETKESNEALKNAVIDRTSAVLDGAYTALEKAGEKGLPVSEVMDIVKELVTNASAFTLRMKTVLRGKGNPYRLERIKHFGTPHYVFLPFNIEQNEQ